MDLRGLRSSYRGRSHRPARKASATSLLNRNQSMASSWKTAKRPCTRLSESLMKSKSVLGSFHVRRFYRAPGQCHAGTSHQSAAIRSVGNQLHACPQHGGD
jgi:hypothetical protein